MKDYFATFQKKLVQFSSLGLTFLCLGVIVQLLIGESLLGWDPVGNIQDAGSSFIGIIAFVVLYLLFKKKTE